MLLLQFGDFRIHDFRTTRNLGDRSTSGGQSFDSFLKFLGPFP